MGQVVELAPAEAKHAEVKRLELGEHLVITDGARQAVRCTWAGQGRAEVVEVLQMPQRRPWVTVVQALPKAERSELAVDLMVQVGADAIVPWESARTIARWGNKESKAVAKWQNAAVAAAKQARRLQVPQVTGVLRNLGELPGFLDDFLWGDATPPSARTIVALHETASVPLASAQLDCDELVLLVGPEGGIAPEELEALSAMGGTPIRLGPEVLRTASAAAVALGAIGVLTGRWATG